MRPVRLTMQAFGPYSTREIIDFRDAVDAGLFGIYGSTGSGKSTIFSAMTFALFGEAAKSEQDAPSLRSDHAETDLITEVEFVFDIGERRFVIVRRPDQLRPKLRGDGDTKLNHEAFLFDATGMSLDEISDKKRGKKIEEKKVRLVDAAVEGLLGYGSDQFRQIVLLPQGRFEKFLSAKTKERLEILRDLFDVSLYRQLSEKLKADAEAIESRVRKEREHCSRRLASEHFESTDALKVGIEEAKKQLSALQTRENAARAALKKAQTAMQKAQALGEKFEASESAHQVFKKLQECSKSMNELGVRIKRVEKAQLLMDLENAVQDAEKDVITAEDKCKSAKAASEDASSKSAEAAEALKNEEKKASELDELKRSIDDLERHKKTLEQSKDQIRAVEQAISAELNAGQALEAAKTKIAKAQTEKDSKTAALKLARENENKRVEVNRRVSQLNAALEAAESYEKMSREVAKSKKNFEKLRAGHNTLKKAETRASEAYKEAEKRLSEAQALHLATKLSDDEPCPVCGSLDHPSPATGSIEHTGLNDAFLAAKAAWENAVNNNREAEKELAGAQSELNVYTTNLSDHKKPDESVSSIRDQIETEEKTLEELGPESDIATAENEIDQLADAISKLEVTRDQLRGDHEAQKTLVSTEEGRLEEKLSSVPENLRDPEALTNTIARKSAELTDRQKKKSEVEKAANETRETALLKEKDFEAAKNAHKQCIKLSQKAEETFNARLRKLDLKKEGFDELKSSFETLDQDRKTVEKFRNDIFAAEQDAKKKADEIRDLDRPNMDEIETNLNDAQSILDRATDDRAAKQQRLIHLSKLQDELADMLRTLAEEEEASGPLRNLAALSNGENPQKLDLETFAIGAMFDQVLEAANERLGPMTSNRYRLERDIEGIGRGRRGLGIQVFDIETGKRRPTATLSGGETFIAALSLALGLADIVESASGKVRLDTIFIDEGFGSLDTENGTGTLDQVLNVLNSLVSQNRSVGLISHVPLVQEVVPNGFYVQKGLSGSTVESRTLL